MAQDCSPKTTRREIRKKSAKQFLLLKNVFLIKVKYASLNFSTLKSNYYIEAGA